MTPHIKFEGRALFFSLHSSSFKTERNMFQPQTGSRNGNKCCFLFASSKLIQSVSIVPKKSENGCRNALNRSQTAKFSKEQRGLTVSTGFVFANRGKFTISAGFLPLLSLSDQSIISLLTAIHFFFSLPSHTFLYSLNSLRYMYSLINSDHRTQSRVLI